LRELSKTLVEFWDEGEHRKDHEGFENWQRRNRYGHALNFLADGTTVFHKSGCMHIREYSDPKVSLTKHRKLCSPEKAELIAVAGKPSLDFDLCETCSRKSHDQL